MLVSMTGFGAAARTSESLAVKVEVRTLNHRFFDLTIRMTRGYQSIEDRIRRLAGESIRRGRTEIFVEVEEFHGRERTVKLDQRLLDGYRHAFAQAAQALGDSHSLKAEMLLGIPGIFVVEEHGVDAVSAWPLIEAATQDAIGGLVLMRRSEGARLEADILSRLDRVEQLLEMIAARSPEMVEAYRLRLAEKVREILGSHSVDEHRLALEAALFADKSNIDEEITRAKSHIGQFRSACRSDEAVGRKLDFLLQELNREANTIGSKAQDSDIAGLAVEVKAEVEKIREQAQNIE